VRKTSPCRAEYTALVLANLSGTVPPVAGAQYAGSTAASCAAMLLACQAHSRKSTSQPVGEPSFSYPHR
jgi:hypothetical protein